MGLSAQGCKDGIETSHSVRESLFTRKTTVHGLKQSNLLLLSSDKQPGLEGILIKELRRGPSFQLVFQIEGALRLLPFPQMGEQQGLPAQQRRGRGLLRQTLLDHRQDPTPLRPCGDRATSPVSWSALRVLVHTNDDRRPSDLRLGHDRLYISWWASASRNTIFSPHWAKTTPPIAAPHDHPKHRRANGPVDGYCPPLGLKPATHAVQSGWTGRNSA